MKWMKEGGQREEKEAGKQLFGLLGKPSVPDKIKIICFPVLLKLEPYFECTNQYDIIDGIYLTLFVLVNVNNKQANLK